MKKLKLNLEDLKVKSFDTLPAEAQSTGTVYGQSNTWEFLCCCEYESEATWNTGCPGCGGTSPSCFTDCYSCYNTGQCCANDSAPGYASCGTTCGEPSCAEQCPPSLWAPPYC